VSKDAVVSLGQKGAVRIGESKFSELCGSGVAEAVEEPPCIAEAESDPVLVRAGAKLAPQRFGDGVEGDCGGGGDALVSQE